MAAGLQLEQQQKIVNAKSSRNGCSSELQDIYSKITGTVFDVGGNAYMNGLKQSTPKDILAIVDELINEQSS